jgi:hypothetical protein
MIFFLQLQSEIYLFSLKGTTLFHLIQKFQKLIHVFNNIRAYPNSQKTHFITLVL